MSNPTCYCALIWRDAADVADEQVLRRRIAELQEYRRNGVTTGAEAEVFEAAKIARVRSHQLLQPRTRHDVAVEVKADN
jgi:hypothetical protein